MSSYYETIDRSMQCLLVTMIETAGDAADAKQKLKEEQKHCNYMAERNQIIQNHLNHILFDILPAQENSIYSAIGPIRNTIYYSTRQVGPWCLGQDLGEGQFGKVFQAINTVTRKQAAIKIISKEKIEDIRMLEKVCLEVKAMKKMRKYGSHQNVASFLDHYHLPNSIVIVQEFARGGDLFSYFECQNFDLQTETVIREIAYGLVCGLQSMHSKGICHRDLKAENILLDEWKPGQPLTHKNIKIADFGFCAISSSLDFCPCFDLAGTPGFYPPEAMDAHMDENKELFYDGYKFDSWNLGCVLLEMIIGWQAFESIWMKAYDGAGSAQLNRELPKALQKVFNHHIPNNEMGDFVKSLLIWDPSKRPNVSQMGNHGWLQSFSLPNTVENSVL